MKLLNQYSNEQEAYIDKGFLDNYDIRAHIEAGAMSEIFPAPAAGTSTVNLYVPESAYVKARSLLFDRKP